MVLSYPMNEIYKMNKKLIYTSLWYCKDNCKLFFLIEQ
jgi:hypothetical protein